MSRSLATALLAFLFVLFVGFALTPKHHTYAALQPPSCLTSTLFLPLTMHQPGNQPLLPVLPGGDQPPQDDPEAGSAGTLIARGIEPNRFNPLTQTLTIDVVCATFSTTTNAVTVILNNTALPSTAFTVTPERLVIQPASWHEGLNNVQIIADDSKGKTLGMTLTFWAGAAEMEVRVYNETGDFIEGVQVRAALGDDQSIYATAITDSGGRVIFQNLPDRTIIFEAHTADNQYGSAAKRGVAGFMTFLKLLDINPPSPIDNNDFSLGTEGWEIGDAPVTIVPHQEDPRGCYGH